MVETVSSDSVAQDQLRAFVERIERIESEITDLNHDKSEIYSEAKGNGFDVKVLRKIIADRRKDYSARMEFETLYDLYAAALGMQAAPRETDDDNEPSHVHAREADQFQAKALEGKADTAAQSAAPPDRSASRTSRGVDTPTIVPEAPKPLPVDQGHSAAVSITQEQRPAEAKTSVQEPLSSGSGEVQDESAIHLSANSPATATSVQASELGDAVELAGASIGHKPGGSHESVTADNMDTQGAAVEPSAHLIDENSDDERAGARAPGSDVEPVALMRDGAEAARLAHNQEVVGASPAPATNFPVTDKSGEGAASSSAPLAHLKTTDEVADDMGLPGEAHPGCRKPKTCGRFSHTGLCADCRGEDREAA